MLLWSVIGSLMTLGILPLDQNLVMISGSLNYILLESDLLMRG